MPDSHPVLSCADSASFEAAYFKGDESAEWQAMNQAGKAVAGGILQDLTESGPAPPRRILVLVGKGHNGGDAVIAVHHLLKEYQQAEAVLLFPFGMSRVKPLVRASLEALQEDVDERLKWMSLRDWTEDQLQSKLLENGPYDLVIDGVLGMQFKPPLRSPADRLFRVVNELPIRMRAAVDLPSGVGDESDDLAFRADFTYATGLAKAPLFESENRKWVGRVRYLDLGFFETDAPESPTRILLRSNLGFVERLRMSDSHKRHFGHLLIVGGSATMPGAVLMTVQAAVKAGAGLVTACVPENIVEEASTRCPEAMWVPMPLIPGQPGMALEGVGLIREKILDATAVALGPGMGRCEETQTLIKEIVGLRPLPVLLDADALQRSNLECLSRSPFAVISPHAGELARLKGERKLSDDSDAALMDFAKEQDLCVVAKGPVTRITQGEAIYYSTHGGPILARGGSGDILSGIIGARMCQPDVDGVDAVCEAVMVHGHLADCLARAKGATCVATTELLELL